MSIYFIEGDESVDMTKICAVRKSYSDYANSGIVIFLEGGHTVPIMGSEADKFKKAYKEFQDRIDMFDDVDREEPLIKTMDGFCREM